MDGNNKKEKTKGIIPYTMGEFTHITSYLITSNLTYALTESYGITAVVVGMIFLLSRVFDGVTDIIAGYIIDRTNTKWGKARPYELFYIPLWIFVVLSFSVPSFSTTGKVVWVFLTYNMSQSVCYTFTSCLTPVRLKRSFQEKGRVKAVSVAALVTTISSVVVSTMVPILIGIFKEQPHGWTIIASIFAVPCILAGLCRFLLLKEMEVEEEQAVQVKVPFFKSLKILVKNKYIFMIGAALLMLAINNALGTSATYYFTYIIGDVSAAAIPGLISSIGLLTIAFLPKAMEKLGSRRILLLGFGGLTVGSLLKYLFPTNVAWLAVCMIFAQVGVLYISSMKHLTVIECMTYGEWKTDTELEGIYSSVIGVADKIGLGLGSFILGLILQIGGYDGALTNQPASAMTSIQFLYCGLPAVLGIIGIICVFRYDLDKRLPGIKQELSNKKGSVK